MGLLVQAWDFVEFRWDRYVIAYGFYDQARAFFGLRSLWGRLRMMLFGPETPPDPTQPVDPDAAPEPKPQPTAPARVSTAPAQV